VQRNHRRLSFLHGFLGSPSDWDEVITHLPGYDCQALTYPFNVPQDTVLIGYSMGGRIALRHPNPKILISTHPGLVDVAEKEARWRLDHQWATLLQNIDLSIFLEQWYNQPVFDSLRTHANFPTILARRALQDPHTLAEMLIRESLANQMFAVPPNAHFIHGQFDQKYSDLYRSLALNSHEIPDAGHAAHLENPKACAEAIMQLLN